MKQYLLFGFSDSYPRGGMNDFLFSFDTIEEFYGLFTEKEIKEEYYQILNTSTMEYEDFYYDDCEWIDEDDLDEDDEDDEDELIVTNRFLDDKEKEDRFVKWIKERLGCIVS
ncbi:hypothetical protein ACLMAB_05675 [Brevibacillus laterosporus]